MNPLCLALNTASEPFSFTITHNNIVLCSLSSMNSRSFTEECLELIQTSLKQHQFTFKDIQVIGIILGPGSYTGLRIGISYAKTLANTLQCPIYAIDGLQCLANQHAFSRTVIGVSHRSKKGYYYFQLYQRVSATKSNIMSDLISLSEPHLVQFLRHFSSALSLVGHIPPLLPADTPHITRFPSTVSTTTLAHHATQLAVENIPSEIDQLRPFYFHNPVIGQPKKTGLSFL